MKRSSLPWCGIGLLGLACCVTTVHAQDRLPLAQQVAGFGRPVSVARLDAVRGGFDLGDGLQASFGIQRAVYVDGNLVTYLNVTIPDLAHITTQQAVSLAAALGTVNVQVGAGNTVDTSSSTAGAAGRASTVVPPVTQANTPSSPIVTSTVIPASIAQANAATTIQNTVDNQVIRSLTTLNVSVNALNALRNQNLQQSLQTVQQLQALSH
ncbi:hypothetical protein [Dyella sp.]|uniref:hypothetical protein n=1 Tax=Dyella sp. TaxID=1869338 RepID=UPI002D78B6DC|nr:hypothetical protein [Dyella sp.]HET7332300.1 hypothetical protein [Dyella sp.]